MSVHIGADREQYIRQVMACHGEGVQDYSRYFEQGLDRLSFYKVLRM